MRMNLISSNNGRLPRVSIEPLISIQKFSNHIYYTFKRNAGPTAYMPAIEPSRFFCAGLMLNMNRETGTIPSIKYIPLFYLKTHYPRLNLMLFARCWTLAICLRFAVFETMPSFYAWSIPAPDRPSSAQWT